MKVPSAAVVAVSVLIGFFPAPEMVRVLMIAMTLMPDASHCEALAGLAGLLADVPFARASTPEGQISADVDTQVDAWPSRMSSQMGGAALVYVHTMQLQAREKDLRSIFDDAPCAAVGSVEEQRQFKTQWFESLRDATFFSRPSASGSAGS